MDNCSIDGCTRAARARGWCMTHYIYWAPRVDGRTCSGPSSDASVPCGRPLKYKDLCAGHGDMLRRMGELRPLKRHSAARSRELPTDMTIPAAKRFHDIGWTEDAAGCWIWNKPRTITGYGVFRDAPRHKMSAHRFAYELAYGVKLGRRTHIAHSCDNPPCVNPAHLSAGTSLDNMRDMVEKGRSTHGEKNPGHKLTIEQVEEIMARGRAGESSKSIARDYPVGDSHIRSIVRGERWQTALRVHYERAA